MSGGAGGYSRSGGFIAEDCRMDEQKCKDCGSTNIIDDTFGGSVVCTDCGVVQGKLISDEAEWRNFDDDGGSKADPNRVGGPENQLLGDMEYMTTLDGGTALGRIQNREAFTTAQRNLVDAFKKTSELARRLGLPRTIEDMAKNYFKRVHEHKDLNKMGRKTDAFIAACIFCACKKANNERTIKELCAMTGLERKHVGRCITKVKNKAFKILSEKGTKKAPMHHNYVPNLRRVCQRANLKLSPRIDEALPYVEKERSRLGLLEGKQPDTIVAALLLLVMRELGEGSERNFSENDVATMVSVSAQTVLNAYNELKEHKDKLILK